MNVAELILQLQSLDPLVLVVCAGGLGDQLVAAVEFTDYVELKEAYDPTEHYRIEKGAAITAVLIGSQRVPARQPARKTQ